MALENFLEKTRVKDKYNTVFANWKTKLSTEEDTVAEMETYNKSCCSLQDIENSY